MCASILIPRVSVEVADITIVGKTPLIVARWQQPLKYEKCRKCPKRSIAPCGHVPLKEDGCLFA